MRFSHHKPLVGILLLGMAVLSGGLLLLATPTSADGRLAVAASLPPLATLAEEVGGPQVAVSVLIPAGRSPHSYEPSPGDVRRLAQADLLVLVGHPSHLFEQRLVAARENDAPQLVLTELAAGTPAAGSAHPWLSPPVLVAAARALAGELAELDPVHAAAYRERAERFAAEVEQLDGELRRQLVASPCRTFLVDHPAWDAFAAHYGLHQLAVEVDGKEPGPATLVRVVAAARAVRVRLLLVQPGVPQARSRSVAQAVGAEERILDPLSPDLLGTLRRAAQAVSEGCRP